MTENNYDKLKDAICELVNLAEDATSREVFEMLDNAGADVIDCLDKLIGYEAIGTVEELKAIKEHMWTSNDIAKEYLAIGTIEEFKDLKEKSVAKKAGFDNEDGWETYICPNCGKTVGEHQKYCWNCGQALET